MSASQWYLPSFGADPNFVVTAGESSGAYLSNQLLFVHSDVIKGAGTWIGGSYMSGLKVFETGGLPWGEDEVENNKAEI